MSDKLNELLSQLNAPDESDRRYAIEDLGELADVRSVFPIATCLGDASAAIREAAVEALLKQGSADAALAVSPWVSGENVPARNAACEVLTGLGEKSFPVLRDLIANGNDDVRKFGLDSLLAFGSLDPATHEDLLVAVREQIQNVNENVAGAALEVLAMRPGLVPAEVLISVLGRGVWLETNALIALKSLDTEESTRLLEGINPESVNPSCRYLLKRRETA